MHLKSFYQFLPASNLFLYGKDYNVWIVLSFRSIRDVNCP